jgi:toxin YhaV
MEINGWQLFQHPLFKLQYDKLLAEAENIRVSKPESFATHNTIKVLARITKLITEEIPADPSHDRFNQGNTLGTEYRHWKRAKFGRYRLFFRYDARAKVHGKGKAIIYAWVNDEKTLRKEGDKNDPYALFARRLAQGKPPDLFDELLKEAREFDADLKKVDRD